MIELDTAASALGPALEELGRLADARAGEIESLRRLPPEICDALVDTGLCRAWAPTGCGGLQLAVPELLEHLEALAYYDGATAWCAMIAATTSILGGFLPERWAVQIYGEPRAVTGGHAAPLGRARPVDGGLVVTGHWQWGSGTFHCTHIAGGT